MTLVKYMLGFNGHLSEDGLTSIQSGIDVATFHGNGRVGIGDIVQDFL